MKNIYLIFSFTGTFFSTFLRFMSGEKYIHVSLSFDENLTEVYSFGRYNPRWAFPCGFSQEDFNRVVKVFKRADCQVYVLPLTNEEYKKLKKEVMKYKNNRENYHYNIAGLVPIQFNKVCRRRYHYVCSQFIGKIFEDTKIHKFKKDYSIVRPNDIREIPRLSLKYEGKLLEYLRTLKSEKA